MTTVGMLVFEGFDLLDVGAPYEVLLTASRLVERDATPGPFEVAVVGLSPAPVTAYGGMVVTPTATLGTTELDVLVVPGAIDLWAALASDELLDVVRGVADDVEAVGSVCTGAFALGRAGLLDGRAWTTHWEDVDALAAEVGPDGARHDVRWVDTGDVVTGGGLSCGLDLGLHLVERYAGRELAVATARQVDHAWDPDAGLTTG